MSETLRYSSVLIIAVLASSLAQILLKKAASVPRKNIKAEYLNWQVFVSYLIFGLAAAVGMYVLRYLPISLVPILESAAYVFVAILSWIILKEKLKMLQIFGIILIITGIVVFNL